MYKERSFDGTLNRLFERKRGVSRALLAPTKNSKNDLTELYTETFQGVSHNTVSYDVRQIDVMEHRGFEHWVTEELKAGSYHAWATASSGDGGVDVFAERQNDGVTLLVQCKHTGNIDEPCGVNGVRQIAASLKHDAYRDLDRELIELMVVTNARSFSAPAEELATANHIELIARDGLPALRTHGQAAGWSEDNHSFYPWTSHTGYNNNRAEWDLQGRNFWRILVETRVR